MIRLNPAECFVWLFTIGLLIYLNSWQAYLFFLLWLVGTMAYGYATRRSR